MINFVVDAYLDRVFQFIGWEHIFIIYRKPHAIEKKFLGLVEFFLISIKFSAFCCFYKNESELLIRPMNKVPVDLKANKKLWLASNDHSCLAILSTHWTAKNKNFKVSVKMIFSNDK